MHNTARASCDTEYMRNTEECNMCAGKHLLNRRDANVFLVLPPPIRHGMRRCVCTDVWRTHISAKCQNNHSASQSALARLSSAVSGGAATGCASEITPSLALTCALASCSRFIIARNSSPGAISRGFFFGGSTTWTSSSPSPSAAGPFKFCIGAWVDA